MSASLLHKDDDFASGSLLRVSERRRSTLAELLRLRNELQRDVSQSTELSVNQALRAPSVGQAIDEAGLNAAAKDSLVAGGDVNRVSSPPSPSPLHIPRHKMQKCARPPSKAKKAQTSVKSKTGAFTSTSATAAPVAREDTARKDHPWSGEEEPLASASSSTSTVLMALRSLREEYQREAQAQHCWRDYVNFREVVKHGSDAVGRPSPSPGNSIGGSVQQILEAGGSQPFFGQVVTDPVGATATMAGVTKVSRSSSLHSATSSGTSRSRGLPHGIFTSIPRVASTGAHTSIASASVSLSAGPTSQAAATLPPPPSYPTQHVGPPPLPYQPTAPREEAHDPATAEPRQLLPMMRLSQPWTLRTSVWHQGSLPAEGTPQGHTLTTDRLYELLSAWNYLTSHLTATVFDAPPPVLPPHRLDSEKKGADVSSAAPPSAATDVTPPKMDFKSALVKNLKRDTATSPSAGKPEPACAAASSGTDPGSEVSSPRITSRRVMEAFPAGLPITLALEDVEALLADEQQGRQGTALTQNAEAKDSASAAAQAESDDAPSPALSSTTGAPPPCYVRVCVTHRGLKVVGNAAAEEGAETPAPSIAERLNRRREGLVQLVEEGQLPAPALRGMLNDSLLVALTHAPPCPTFDQLLTQVEEAIRQRQQEEESAGSRRGEAHTSTSEVSGPLDGDAFGASVEAGEGPSVWGDTTPARYMARHVLASESSVPSQSPSKDGIPPEGSAVTEALYELLGFTVDADVSAAQEDESSEAAGDATSPPVRVVDLAVTLLVRVRGGSTPVVSEAAAAASYPATSALSNARTEASGKEAIPEAVARDLALAVLPAEFVLSPTTSPTITVTSLDTHSDSAASSLTVASSEDPSSPTAVTPAKVTAAALGRTEEPAPMAEAPLQQPPLPSQTSTPEAERSTDGGGATNDAQQDTKAAEAPLHQVPWHVKEHTGALEAAVDRLVTARIRQRALLDGLAAEWGVTSSRTVAALPTTKGSSADRGGKKKSKRHAGDEAAPAHVEMLSASRVVTALAAVGYSSPTPLACGDSNNSHKKGRGKPPQRPKEGCHEMDCKSVLEEAAAVSVASAYALMRELSQTCVSHLVDAMASPEGESEGRPQSSMKEDADDDSVPEEDRAWQLLEGVADAFRDNAVDVSGLPSDQRLVNAQTSNAKGKGKHPKRSSAMLPCEAIVAAAPSEELLPVFQRLTLATTTSDTTLTESTVTLFLSHAEAAGVLESAVSTAADALHTVVARTEAANRALQSHIADVWEGVFLPTLEAHWALLAQAAEDTARLHREAAAALASLLAVPPSPPSPSPQEAAPVEAEHAQDESSANSTEEVGTAKELHSDAGAGLAPSMAAPHPTVDAPAPTTSEEGDTCAVDPQKRPKEKKGKKATPTQAPAAAPPEAKEAPPVKAARQGRRLPMAYQQKGRAAAKKRLSKGADGADEEADGGATAEGRVAGHGTSTTATRLLTVLVGVLAVAGALLAMGSQHGQTNHRDSFRPGNL